jgi:hypothetical protein
MSALPESPMTMTELPEGAVAAGVEYLQLSTRDVSEAYVGIPQLPWRQYITAKKDFGRYEAHTSETGNILRVDYRLWSLLASQNYNFLDVVEITERAPDKAILQHAIFVPHLQKGGIATPNLAAGRLNFWDYSNDVYLMRLARDENTHEDVANMVSDILDRSSRGILEGTS